MKISKNTLNILKNFAFINNSIYVNENKILKTIAAGGSIIAVATIDEDLPTFAIYSLEKFLAAMSLFDESELNFTFENTSVLMSGTNKKMNYRFSDPDHILDKPKDSEVYKKFDTFDFSFDLSNETLTLIQKASRLAGLTHLKIHLENGKGLMTLTDIDNSLSNEFEVEIVGEGTGDVTLIIDNLKVIDGNYRAEIAKNKLVKFSNKDFPLFYLVSVIPE